MKLFNMFKMYKGLRREIYILFYGRIVTNMGSLIWPMLTLILTNKLGMSASQVASLLLVMSLVQLPFALLGGKLADRFNKRNIIIVCDLVTVACYILCFFIEISMTLVLLFFIGGLFATLEHPAYDALVADLSTAAERERAYSLSYLGANLGLVLAPTLGGLLFENHLSLAFLITGVSTLSSTILIFFLIKDVTRSRDTSPGSYELDAAQGASTLSVLRERPVILLFFACAALSSLVYSQFNFLIPINMERLYAAQGAVLFGTLTSLNCIVVVLGTPLITARFAHIREAGKIIIGEALIGASLAMYIFIQGCVPLYYVSMLIFTVGEIFATLGKQPYIMKRIPATHRGRVASLNLIIATGFQVTAQKFVGVLADTRELRFVWCVIALLGAASVLLCALLRRADRKEYPLLYAPAALKEETL
ncbi:MAG: MFS transporter [Oscillospiraceae bacterium]|nr:MFS transporter [Oscillospiraceae bacterium]